MSLAAEIPCQTDRPAKRRSLELECIGVSKHFGAVRALQDVSMKVRAGTVHALLGENGAGKSTLVKCIMGYHAPDGGSVLVDRREREIRNPRDAHGLGIGMVYQHFTLVPNMTVAENLVMSRADVPAVIDWSTERRNLDAFMAGMPFAVPRDARVNDLSAGQKQKVEILKQLYLDGRILILDEPTSVLTPQEADEVLGLLRDMAHRDELTILMITHKFREVSAFCDDVTILCRGRFAGAGRVNELSVDELAAMMVGEARTGETAARRPRNRGPVRIELEGLRANDNAGAPAVRAIDLTVHAGEIVGIAGVSGNGQSELVECLSGQRVPVAGSMAISGEPYSGRRPEMAKLKLFCLPEEPLRNAVVARMSVAENLAFRRFDEPPNSRGGWWLNAGAMRRSARDLIARYRVKASSPDADIASLSGGNVQRAVLARELSGDVDVLVVANPCFGLDFSAVAEIRRQIMEARNNGVAVLLVSEDLDEILELSDRIVVMSGGQLVFETTAADTDVNVIGRHMAGH